MHFVSYRKAVTDMNKNMNTSGEQGSTSDKEVLGFYNLATGRILTGLEVWKCKLLQCFWLFLLLFKVLKINFLLFTSFLERSWQCTIFIQLENSNVLFQYDPMFRECWHWIDIRFKVSAVILYALELIFKWWCNTWYNDKQ